MRPKTLFASIALSLVPGASSAVAQTTNGFAPPSQLQRVEADDAGEYGAGWETFRGIVELSLYAGWTIYDSEMDLETGGAARGGGRLTINFWEDSFFGLDLDANMTRINVSFDRRRLDGQLVTADDEVTISTLTAGATLRFPSWFVQPFLSARGGFVILDDIETRGVVDGTFGQVDVDSAIGTAVSLEVGLDFRLSKHWTLRLSGGVDLYLVEWPEDSESYLASNVIQGGFVWHFDR